MRRAIYALGFFAALSFSGCGSYDLGSLPPTRIIVNVTSPTWDNGIRQLAYVKCASCHIKIIGQFTPANTPAIDFRKKEVFDAKADRIRARVFLASKKPMPPLFATQLTANELLALANYLKSLN